MISNTHVQTAAYACYTDELDKRELNQGIEDEYSVLKYSGLEPITSNTFKINGEPEVYTGLNRNGAYEIISSIQMSQIDALAEQYKKEKKIVMEFIANNNGDLDSKVKGLIIQTVRIGASRIGMEITDTESILFSLSFENHKMAYIKTYINDEDDTNEAYFSFYEENICVFNGIGKFSNVISDLTRITKAKSFIHFYGLSQRTYPTT